ncbi:MAG: hypothetical protein WCT37_01975 [Patescibacteria group bacterium]|jgi:hypothetical protein
MPLDKNRQAELAREAVRPPTETKIESAPKPSTEISQENRPEKQFLGEVKAGPERAAAASIVSPAHPNAVADRESEKLHEIEEILAEDLEEIYLGLSPAKKEEFKREGEKAASLILVLLRQVKIHTAKIYRLIRRWLKIIPGVSRYFLAQEAKIKADRLVADEERERQRR